MKIQVNTDHNIEGHEALTAHVSELVGSALGRVSEHITRVEVYLSDEHAGKGSQDGKRCAMEARLQGRPPIAVTHQAATVHQAVNGAAEKLTRSVDSTLGALRDQKRHGAEPAMRAAEPAADE